MKIKFIYLTLVSLLITNAAWWAYLTFKPVVIYDRLLINLGDSNQAGIFYTDWSPIKSYRFADLNTSNRVGVLDTELFVVTFMQEYVPAEVDTDVKIQLVRDNVKFTVKYFKASCLIFLSNIFIICALYFMRKVYLHRQKSGRSQSR